MDEYLKEIERLTKAQFPDAVAVNITVNAYGVTAEPTYKSLNGDVAMQMLSGGWIDGR